MTKTLIIKFCESCPFFDSQYPIESNECGKLDKVVPHGLVENKERWLHPIPEWCPLGDVTVVEEKVSG